MSVLCRCDYNGKHGPTAIYGPMHERTSTCLPLPLEMQHGWVRVYPSDDEMRFGDRVYDEYESMVIRYLVSERKPLPESPLPLDDE